VQGAGRMVGKMMFIFGFGAFLFLGLA